jgi:hypothetical protein
VREKFKSILVLACLVIVSATLVDAQTNRRFVIDIPFDFIVAGETLPAGKYTVERFDSTRPNVLAIKNSDHHMMRVFLARRVERVNHLRRSSNLVFKQRGSAYYLYQVWVAEDFAGNQLLGTDEKGERNQDRNNFTLVRLEANK